MNLKNYTANNGTIRYRVSGNGFPVVLLHGYLQSGALWSHVVDTLSQKYTVIVPDLPGHDHSERISSTLTMDLMAEVIHGILIQEHVTQCILGGHSLGGYVALEYAAHHRANLHGLFLINSHPFTDAIPSSINRNREITLLQQGKRDLLFRMNTARAFHPDYRTQHQANIQAMLSCALKTEEASCIAVQRGMMARADHSNMLSDLPFQALMVHGEADTVVDEHTRQRFSASSQRHQHVTLPDAGHMTFLEVPDALLTILQQYIGKRIAQCPC
jgi:pimeloyl-ACP methyl ester carboxylesterase